MEPIISVKDVVKEYVMGEVKIRAANRVSFEVNRGELVIVLGPSGAGKSTALNILGGTDFSTSGEVWVNGKGISKLDKNELMMYRRKYVGLTLQFYSLMPNFTAPENTEIAAQICDDPMNSTTVLTEVGPGERMANLPVQLPGGEQQRVSIARAVTRNLTLLLCDRPTGALDYTTGKSTLKLLQHVNRESKKTIMIIAHNSTLALMVDKVVRIKNGKVEAMERNKAPVPVERIGW